MQELKNFLQQHPHLQAYQDRFDKEMSEMPDEYRFTVIAKHLAWNLQELEVELKLLQVLLQKEM